MDFTRICYVLLFSSLFFMSCDDEDEVNEEIVVQTGLQTNVAFNYDGVERTYDVYIPTSFDMNQQLPLLFNLHGFNMTTELQRLVSGFDSLAEIENFIVVSPQGLSGALPFEAGQAIPAGTEGNLWNIQLEADKLDDLGFIDALIDEMSQKYNIDLSRVYSTGFSMGGYMSYTLACNLGDRIAAIASVGGGMSDDQANSCSPTREIPVLQIAGTADFIVPFTGFDAQVAISETMDYWAGENNCTISPVDSIALSDLDNTDNSTVQLLEYSNCTGGANVQLYLVEGGGHAWPGSPFPGFFNNAGIGPINRDINASAIIWEFFEQYQHPNLQ